MAIELIMVAVAVPFFLDCPALGILFSGINLPVTNERFTIFRYWFVTLGIVVKGHFDVHDMVFVGATESATVGLLQNKIQSGCFVGATESATVGLLLNKIIQSGGGDGDGGDGGGSGGEGGKSDEGVSLVNIFVLSHAPGARL